MYNTISVVFVVINKETIDKEKSNQRLALSLFIWSGLMPMSKTINYCWNYLSWLRGTNMFTMLSCDELLDKNIANNILF